MLTVNNIDELVGWANIGRNLRVSKSTAVRWEETLDFPVKRAGGIVYADEQELFDWKVGENNRRRKMRGK